MKRGLWAGVFLLAVGSACASACGGGGGGAGAQGGGTDSGGPSVTDSGVLPSDDSGTNLVDATVDATPPDTTPPTFGGATSATALGQTQIAVTWLPATDNVTPQASIAYRVYIGTAAGAESFAAPVVTSPAGATGTVINALNPFTTYFIVVHAVDQAGNEDDNHVEVSAKTTDTTPPVFGGAQTVTGTGASSVLVGWKAATDVGCPQSAISYNIYASQTQGGESFTTPSFSTAPGATSGSVSGFAEFQPVFVVVRAVDAAGNEDHNLHEISGYTLDTTAPTFTGAQTATALGNTITLTWTAATDAFVAPSTLVYDVFQASASGAENFASPSYTTVAGATTFTVLNLSLVTKYYYVVRARDQFGNEDTNTNEQSATTQVAADTTPPTFAGLVTAAGFTDTAIDLSWAAATDPYTPAAQMLYDVFTSSASGAENYSTPTYTTPAGATSYTIVGLQPLQKLYVVVRARNLVGLEDKNTVEKSATTLPDTTPPTFAGLASATALSDTQIQLSWPAATDDVSPQSAIIYRVYQGTASGAEGATPVATTAAGQTTITINSLAPKTAYYFIVHAVDQAGNEDHNSIEQTATTFPDTTPPTFGGVTSLVSTSPTTLTASWSPATDDVTPQPLIVYLPYLSTTPGGENFGVSPTPTAPGATTFTFTGLNPSTTYYVVVRSEDQAGNIDQNKDELSQATQADVTPPAFAGASSVTNATDTTLTVIWTAATDNVTPQSLIRYLVCMSPTAGGCSGSNFSVTTTVTGGTSQQFTGLTPLTAYYFVVRAEDQADNIDGNNNQVTGSTTPDTTPPVFAGLASATSTSPTTITLGWVAATDDVTPQDQIVYDIFQASASNGESYAGPTYTTSAGATGYVVTGLLPQQTWYFVVRARDQAGNEAPNTIQKSATVEADTTPPTFAGITSLTATGLTSLQASWNTATSIVPPNSAIDYYVCWSTSTTACKTSFTAMATTAAGALTYAITGLPDNTAYTVVVRAHDPYGNTDSNTVSLTASTLPDTTPPTFSGPPSVTGETATTITLSWPLATDNYSPQSTLRYLLCIAQAPAVCTGSSFVASQILTNQSSFQFTGLAPTTTYNFVVAAEDQANNISTGNTQVSGETVNDTTPPTFPNGALQSATALSDSTIQLSWNIATDNVSTATQITYDIYQATSSGGEAACTTGPTYSVAGTVGSGNPLAQQYTVTGLQPLTAYYFIVRARDAAGNRDCNSTEKSATTFADTTAPVFGTLLGVAVTSDTQLTPSWTAATDDTTPQAQIRYEVCWSTSATACQTSFVANATTTAGALSYTPPARTLIPNTSYTFVVRAEDLSGNVDSNTQAASATTLVDNPPTFAGVGSITNITYDTATVNWPVATDDYTTAANMRYEVCVTGSSNGCSGGSFVGTTGSPVTGVLSLGITGLTPVNTYYVVVRAENQENIVNTINGNNQISFATVQDPNPPTFGGLTSATELGPTSIQLSWTNATDPYTTAAQFVYEVYGGGASGAENYSNPPIATSTGDGTGTINYTIAANAGQTQCYVVRAKNNAGVSDTNTIEHCATTPPTLPTFTTQPIWVGVTTSSLTISWAATATPAATTIDYTVCTTTTSGACANFASGGTSTGTTESADIGSLTSATTYYFVVRATDSTGSTWSNQVSGTTSVVLPSMSGSVTCYPSDSAPYPSYLYITYPGATAGSYPISSYEVCTSLGSAANCSPTFNWSTGDATGSGWIGAPAYNGGVVNGPALTSYENYWVYVRAIDSHGNASNSINAGGACQTSASYNGDVLPFVNGSCNLSGCHASGSGLPGPWSLSYWTGNTPPNYCGGTVPSYIVSDNAASSLIYEVLADSYNTAYNCIPQMPYGGPYNQAYKIGNNTTMVQNWINSGINSN
ncbi:MAG: fibronectin type III domain-containing protein [Polyangiaceae bacterium]